MDDYLFAKLEVLAKMKIVYQDKEMNSPEINAVPDGAFLVKEANNQTLRYNV